MLSRVNFCERKFPRHNLSVYMQLLNSYLMRKPSPLVQGSLEVALKWEDRRAMNILQAKVDEVLRK